MWKIDNGTTSGTTTGSYADALDWKVADLGAKTMLLQNTHVEASLQYRLLGYAARNGIARELVPETVLEAGETAEFHYDRQWDTLVLQTRNGSGPATYALDYEGQGA
jgi:hypothetical protein